ncbi:MAG: tetratricopeptide repeat protein [Thermodesulfobacteriota bacterium]|nr:tetratricopeptide repeat protein [Thermodesulfobacteriota bacterium]
MILRGFWDEGLYLNQRVLDEESQIEKRLLGTTYNNIGGSYDNKGEWDKALAYYLKSEKIRIEVCDRAGLAYTYFNIGAVYLEKNDTKNGEDSIILGVYIAVTQGMKHELSQMEWALGPIIERIGQEAFIEKGRSLCKAKGLSSL